MGVFATIGGRVERNDVGTGPSQGAVGPGRPVAAGRDDAEDGAGPGQGRGFRVIGI